MSTETETDANDESTDDELGPYEYELEENEKTRVATDDGSYEPSHLLRVRPADAERDGAGELYYVDVVDEHDRIELLGHRVGSARSYSKHEMIPLRYREPIEADGWTIVDGAANISADVVDELEAWLEARGVDPADVDVRVNPVHASIKIDTARYLEGDSWDAFISAMRSTDAIEYAPAKKENYVPDENVPDLPTADDVDETEPDSDSDAGSSSGTSVDGELLDDVEEILREDSTPDDPVTSGEISERLELDDGDSNPRAREALRVLTDERGLPIGSGSTGYFLISRESELEKYEDNLDARIAGIEDRKRMVRDAWEEHKDRLAAGEDDG